jgi:hypothetical protein
MKYFKFLCEEYFDRFDSNKIHVEIFVNPTKKELLKIRQNSDSVRFIVDFKIEQVYVTNNLKIIHYDMIGYTKIYDTGLEYNDIGPFMGVAYITPNGKLEARTCDTINKFIYYDDSKDVVKKIEQKDQWTTKYFTERCSVTIKRLIDKSINKYSTTTKLKYGKNRVWV